VRGQLIARFKRWVRGIRAIIRQTDVEGDVSREMKTHIELEQAALIRAGVSADEARRRAAVAFGGLTRFQQEAREQRPLRWIDDFVHDVRYGLRQLRRSPGLTTAAIATVGLGIAAVTTVFSIVNTASFKPLPYREVDRLVAIGDDGMPYIAFSELSADEVVALRRRSHSFERLSVFHEDRGATLTRPGAPRALGITAIDSGMFALLAVKPARGRVPSVDEFRDAKPVVLISDSLWRSRFGASESAVGAHVTISGVDRTIIGVMPEGFRFYERSDAWIPLVEAVPPDRSNAPPSTREVDEARQSVIARRAPGVSMSEARAEVAQIGRTLGALGASSRGRPRLAVRDQIVDRPTSLSRLLPLSSLFLAATFALLVIACVNVANLLLARAVNRRGEVTLRVALGAARGRLIRQLLTESAMLGLAAGILGVVLAGASVKLLITHVPTYGFPSWVRFGIDWRVLGFALFIMLVAVVGFGLAPALEATRVDLMAVVTASGHPGITAAPAIRSGRRLVVVQVALSFALFVVATQLVQTYRHVVGIDAGYQSARVIHSYAYLDHTKYADPQKRVDFVRKLARELAKDPSVEAVAMRSWFRGDFANPDEHPAPSRVAGRNRGDRLKDRELFGPNDTTTALDQSFAPNLSSHFVVSDGYFRVIGVPTVSGRTFDASDTRRSQRVAVLSAALGRRLWPTASPLGKSLRIGVDGAPFIVIGIVGDIRKAISDRNGTHVDDVAELFVSERQASFTDGEYLVRIKTDAEQAKAAIALAWMAVDPEAAPPPLLRTNAEEDGLLALGLRVLGLALAIIALISLVLSMIGIYGVVSYTAARRTREIGIRIALGATARDIRRMIARDGTRLILAGLSVGFVVAIGISKLMGRFAWSVSAVQLATYLSASGAFCAVALVACYLPARRASQMRPRDALLTDL
jgi:predicted permease